MTGPRDRMASGQDHIERLGRERRALILGRYA